MVGKAAATGEKKRGRPRKQREGQPPLSPPFASAVARRQQAAPPPPPAPARRSHRCRRPPRMDDYADYGDYEDDFYCEQLSAEGEAGREEAEDDEEESEGGAERSRREKKFKLLQKLPNHRQGRRSVPPSSSSSSEDDGAGGRDPLKKRRSSGTGRGGDDDNDCADGGNLPRDGSGSGSEDEEDGGRHAAPNCDQSVTGKMMDQCPKSTLLPDKKMLEGVLDKLQKKDIYGVYAEPVDPEELPDYHDVIKNPMDFGTIRKKLVTGVYCNLEQFETDIFLVCTNAMQYNAPDTIYFRQACSIQELARKKFQSIRFDNEDVRKSEQKIQSNSVATKLGKRYLCKSAHIPGGSDMSISATCILADHACDTGHKAEQPCPAEERTSVNGAMDDSLTLENKSEKGEEHSDKSSPVKLERILDKLYEDRRTTYDVSNKHPMIQSDSLFTTFENEQRHLVSVGLDAQYSYARSLARFAGTLGPIAWKIASEKIEKALPAGIEFGPGWVGTYEPLSRPVLSFESQSLYVTHSLCKTDRKERRKEDGMKYAESAATKGLQSDIRGPSDSSIMGVTNRKANQLESSFSCRSLDQSPFVLGFSDRSQPTVMNTMLLKCKPSDMASARDYKAKVGTNISYVKSESAVDITAQRHVQCSDGMASGTAGRISGSRSTKESETRKQPELVSHQSEITSSSMDNRGLSGGKDLGKFGGCSGFIPINQIRALGNCSSHGGHKQAIGDPTEQRSMPGRKKVNDNAKQLMSTAPLPRSNYIGAVPTAAPVWMSVERSPKQKVTEGSDNLKMQAGAASPGNLSSESVSSVSGFFEDNKKKLTPTVPQLPSQAAGEERWVQSKGLSVFPQLDATESPRYHGQIPWQGLIPRVQMQKRDMCPPDLNITFGAPKSPVPQSSGILVDSQQPDLALQL